jgi:hypothetical protein
MQFPLEKRIETDFDKETSLLIRMTVCWGYEMTPQAAITNMDMMNGVGA